MSGRQAEISAPAQGDWWFTLWPASTSHQNSHRKIMSPSTEFMQMVVHLSEDKKMHFHFKMKVLEVLSRQEQAKASSCMWAVSAHASCLISVGVYTARVTQARRSRKGRGCNPIKSQTNFILLRRCKQKSHRFLRQILLQCNFWIENINHYWVCSITNNNRELDASTKKVFVRQAMLFLLI